MKRRQFFTTVGATAIGLPLCLEALAQGRHVRVGLLAPVAPRPDMVSALREGLRNRGYIEGQNLSIELRWPKGSFAQNPEVTAELVRSNVDVIVAWTTPAVTAARAATSTIPIVIVGVSDPMGLGFVRNLARPGGNITGVSNLAADISTKVVELLNDIVPSSKHIGIIFNPNNPASPLQLSGAEAGVRALGLKVTRAGASTPEDYRHAFERLNAERVQGVVLLADPSLIDHAAQIADLAKTARLPTVFQRRENVEAGGLLSYGSNLRGEFRQAANYVDRILRGASPAELPVEQPTTFELVINLETAKAIDLSMPQSLLERANEVIE
jgi:putative tryptophan/tyrosine transport system substrate-binding protein